MKKVYLILFSIFLFSTLQAQDDLDDAFDDGGLSDIKNSVAINVSDLVEGSLSIRYERLIGNSHTLYVEGGLVLYDALIPLKAAIVTNFKDYYNVPSDMHSGFLFGLGYRSYFADQWGFYSSYEIYFRKRKGDYYGDIEFFMGARYGYKYMFDSNIYIDGSIGLGLLTYRHSAIDPAILPANPNDWEPEFTSFGFGIPFKFSVGYSF